MSTATSTAFSLTLAPFRKKKKNVAQHVPSSRKRQQATSSTSAAVAIALSSTCRRRRTTLPNCALLDDSSSAMTTANSTHPLDDLTATEIAAASAAVKKNLKASSSEGGVYKIRFNYITLAEPPKRVLMAYLAGNGDVLEPEREAEVLYSLPSAAISYKAIVRLDVDSVRGDIEGTVISTHAIPEKCQPLFSPDDCNLAETIVKSDLTVVALLKSRYGIEDLSNLVCDPWSVHVATPDFAPLKWREREEAAADTKADTDAGEIAPVATAAPRLVQTFLYWRDDPEDNQYAKPIDLLPVVDLNAEKVIDVSMQPGGDSSAPSIPTASVNYHRAKLSSNSYLATVWRASMPPLDVVQTKGASFTVSGGARKNSERHVTWDQWTFRLGFNYREGLVLHDVRYGRIFILSYVCTSASQDHSPNMTLGLLLSKTYNFMMYYDDTY